MKRKEIVACATVVGLVKFIGLSACVCKCTLVLYDNNVDKFCILFLNGVFLIQNLS